MSTAAISLSSLLPAPVQQNYDRDNEEKETSRNVIPKISKAIPPYGHRKGWIPRQEDDYCDGGAFPEIHVAQYPLGLGKEKQSSNALSLQVDSEGKVRYDALAKYGHGKNKVVHSRFEDLLPKPIDDDDPELQRPDEEEIQETTDKTREALEKLVAGKIAAANPTKRAEKQEPAQYIRYTPSQQGNSYNSGAQQRIIRMVEAQQDPMEPPRFKTNSKIPRAPPSPPAPVMHSPPRKPTVKEQNEWKIPPSISHWKNAKGFTIPLDKRLAADGRGLQSVHINENFAKLAESLYIADRKAREAVEVRAQMERKTAQMEKEKKEENLLKVAEKARVNRSSYNHGSGQVSEEAKERDEFRRIRGKERTREKNISRAAPDKKNRLLRDRDRDISEQIHLGRPQVSKPSADSQFDQRLFGKTSGMDSGFGDDDAYNVYNEPWNKNKNISKGIYVPSRNSDKDMYGDDYEKIVNSNRFVPDQRFSGTEGGSNREGPVAFEKEEDPFGLDDFLEQAKTHDSSNKRPIDDKGSRDHGSKKSRH
ncbi:DgyrCDS10198 [Dimorphilus gyrociliatus]|uniref:DgyrCDS10198 n=1 Tax=Dimorphilus gyrociliatus TaxID=2664684 RepID=A0A7I8W0W0_9ANNE|nr:DgyrCDS10198 [Dimorphilus gyrociliatus]